MIDPQTILAEKDFGEFLTEVLGLSFLVLCILTIIGKQFTKVNRFKRR